MSFQVKRFISAITLSIVGILPLVSFCMPVPNGTVKATGPDQPTPAAPSNPSVEVAVYDADPSHLWNQLYAALYVRTTGDGHSYGKDEIDPLLWESTYLLTGARYQQVMALLNDFVDQRGEKLITHPLLRNRKPRQVAREKLLANI